MVVKDEGEVEDDCKSPQGGGSPSSCSSSSPVKKVGYDIRLLYSSISF
jgi:hypothetical protein